MKVGDEMRSAGAEGEGGGNVDANLQCYVTIDNLDSKRWER